VGRAAGPVVAPADDDVAAGEGVAVVAEIAAFKLEFEVDALPALRTDLALGFAVGEAGLHGFDDVAQFFGDHAEQKDCTQAFAAVGDDKLKMFSFQAAQEQPL
jgi:hypothetical protein